MLGRFSLLFSVFSGIILAKEEPLLSESRLAKSFLRQKRGIFDSVTTTAGLTTTTVKKTREEVVRSQQEYICLGNDGCEFR